MRSSVTLNGALSLPLIYKVVMAHAVSENSGAGDEILVIAGFGALIAGLVAFSLFKGKKDKKK